MSSELPKAIGHYEVTGRVSASPDEKSGVYLARRGGVTYVVHHVEKPANSAWPELERYGRLSRDTAGLPRLVEVVDDGAMLGLAFEPADGVTLARLMAHMRVSEERFPDAAIWYLTHQLAQTLARCHSARGADGKPASLFHGRLAAENILISWDGRIFIMGLCPLVGGVELPGERPSRPSSAWFAPEFHQNAALTPRADAYGVTLLLRALLTGEDRPSPGAVAASLDVLRNDLPGELARALDRGLIVTPTTRATCAELTRWLATMARDEEGQTALREAVEPFETLGALWSNRVTSQLPPSDDVTRGRAAVPPPRKPGSEQTVKVSGLSVESAARLAVASEEVGSGRPPSTDDPSPVLARAPLPPRPGGVPRPRGGELTKVESSASSVDTDVRTGPVEADDDSATMVHDELTNSSFERNDDGEDGDESEFEGTLVLDGGPLQAGIDAARAKLLSAAAPRAGSMTVADDDAPEPASERALVPLAGMPPSLPPPPPPAATAGLAPRGGAKKTLVSAMPPAPVKAGGVPSSIAVKPVGLEVPSSPGTPPKTAPGAAAVPAAASEVATTLGSQAASPQAKGRSVWPWLVLLGVVWGVAAALYFFKFRGGLRAASPRAESSGAVAIAPSAKPLATSALPANASPPSAAPESSAAPAASAPSTLPPVVDVATRKPLSFEAYLTVKSSVDANVYVQGVLVGRTNQRTLSRCRWRNVRLGAEPGPFWLSAMKVEYLPCLGSHETTLEPDAALVAAEKQRKH